MEMIITKPEKLLELNAMLHDGMCELGELHYDENVGRLSLPIWRECREMEPVEARQFFWLWERVRWPSLKGQLAFDEVKSSRVRGENTLTSAHFLEVKLSDDGTRLTISMCEGVAVILEISALRGCYTETSDTKTDFTLVTLRRRRSSTKRGTTA